jgi:hypothetical protein
MVLMSKRYRERVRGGEREEEKTISTLGCQLVFGWLREYHIYVYYRISPIHNIPTYLSPPSPEYSAGKRKYNSS